MAGPPNPTQAVTKGLQYQGLVGIPSHDNKVSQSIYKPATLCVGDPSGCDRISLAHSALTYALLQLRGISCSICSKLAKKLLECALPITVPAQTNPFDAFLAAADSCLTTAWDRVLYECVDGRGHPVCACVHVTPRTHRCIVGSTTHLFFPCVSINQSIYHSMCLESANFSTMTPNASGQVTYALIQPELHFYDDAGEVCV